MRCGRQTGQRAVEKPVEERLGKSAQIRAKRAGPSRTAFTHRQERENKRVISYVWTICWQIPSPSWGGVRGWARAISEVSDCGDRAPDKPRAPPTRGRVNTLFFRHLPETLAPSTPVKGAQFRPQNGISSSMGAERPPPPPPLPLPTCAGRPPPAAGRQ